jgi:photosystem II stability/assembly factor-like uncharacterized protein
LIQADNADLSPLNPDASKAESLAKSSLMANDQPAGLIAAGRAQRHAARRSWRITSDGHVEHSTPQGTWTPAPGLQAPVFRVVATVGNNVWAGGGNGTLFHSSDNGETWTKVAVGQSEDEAIVLIHFDTAQQGSVTSDSGATWTTVDGGQSWTKH